jgi:hypothetical protein
MARTPPRPPSKSMFASDNWFKPKRFDMKGYLKAREFQDAENKGFLIIQARTAAKKKKKEEERKRRMASRSAAQRPLMT